MVQMTDKVDRILGRLYTNFILRDLTFFVSGAMVIISVTASKFKPLGAFGDLLSSDSDLSWIVILAFLAASYVLGVLLQESARLIILTKASKRFIDSYSDVPKKKNGYVRKEELVVKMERLIRKRTHEYTINGVERILFLKQIAATQFSAIFTITIVLYIRSVCDHFHVFGNPGVIISIGLFGVAICFLMYLDKSRQQEQAVYRLMCLPEIGEEITET